MTDAATSLGGRVGALAERVVGGPHRDVGGGPFGLHVVLDEEGEGHLLFLQRPALGVGAPAAARPRVAAVQHGHSRHVRLVPSHQRQRTHRHGPGLRLSAGELPHADRVCVQQCVGARQARRGGGAQRQQQHQRQPQRQHQRHGGTHGGDWGASEAPRLYTQRGRAVTQPGNSETMLTK